MWYNSDSTLRNKAKSCANSSQRLKTFGFSWQHYIKRAYVSSNNDFQRSVWCHAERCRTLICLFCLTRKRAWWVNCVRADVRWFLKVMIIIHLMQITLSFYGVIAKGMWAGCALPLSKSPLNTFPLLLEETLGVLFHIRCICFIVMLSVYFMIPHFRCERYFSNSVKIVYLHVYIQTRITSFLLQRQVCVLECMTIQGVSWCIELLLVWICWKRNNFQLGKK